MCIIPCSKEDKEKMIDILKRMQEEEQNLGLCYICIHTCAECVCTSEELKFSLEFDQVIIWIYHEPQ